MDPWRRLVSIVALLALIFVVGACGGQPGDEPAAEQPEQPAEETPEPEPTAVEPEPEPEPQEPDEPELVGDITLSGEDLEWGNITGPNNPAPYAWTVTVINDTTQTLDIRVLFSILDGNDRVVKTERTSIRLQPAQTRTIREDGSMSYDDALRVEGFLADYDWQIVEG